MIDIGANLTNKAFSEDLPEVLDRAAAAGVERIIVTGTAVAESEQALALVQRYPDVLKSTVGIHPHHADQAEPGWQKMVLQIALRGAVAIGETGLDYFRNFSTRQNQREVFRIQLELASDLDLPLFVHDRDSEGEVLSMLQRHAQTPVVVHCFTGTQALLEAYLELGCYIGLTGWICDERRGNDVAQLAENIPDDRLLIETDSPYLLPRTIQPRPKAHRNEPCYLAYVVQKLATVRSQSTSYIDEMTTNNANRLFRLEATE